MCDTEHMFDCSMESSVRALSRDDQRLDQMINKFKVRGALTMWRTWSVNRENVFGFRLKTTTRAWWPRRALWRETMGTLSSLERSCPSPPKRDSTSASNLANYLPKNMTIYYIIYIFLKSRNAPPKTLFDREKSTIRCVLLYFVALLCSLCTMYYEKEHKYSIKVTHYSFYDSETMKLFTIAIDPFHLCVRVTQCKPIATWRSHTLKEPLSVAKRPSLRASHAPHSVKWNAETCCGRQRERDAVASATLPVAKPCWVFGAHAV